MSLLCLPVIFLLLINAAPLKAQGLPCGDPDVDCPIDGPIIVFAIVMLFLSVKKLTAVYKTNDRKLKPGKISLV